MTRKLLWAAVLAVLAMRLHDALAFPVAQGYDWVGHLQAVRLGRVPVPTDGWAGYHPPLYYLVAGFWGHPQVVSAVASLVAIGLIWWPARRLVPGYELVAVAFVAALPAEVIVAPMVYNVPFGYLFSALFLAVAVEIWSRDSCGLGWAVLLGLVAGLGILSRPDCLMLVVFQVLLWGRRGLHSLVGSVMTASVCGWLYLRNLAEYGRPLLANTDNDLFPHFLSESWFSLPGFRTPGYYLFPDLSIFVSPVFPQGYPSYWSTMFGSLWWDYFGCFYPAAPLGLARVFLAFGVVWLGVAAAGVRRAPFPVWLNLLLTVALQMAHSLRLPEDGAVKAVYLFSGYTALGLLFALGCRRLGRPRLVEGMLALWGFLVAVAFWY